MDKFVTPYGRFAWFEATKPDEKGKYKTALLLPKNAEGMASLVAVGLSKDLVETNLKDVESFINAIDKAVREDGKHPKFNPKKIFKCGDEKSAKAVENFKDNPENAGKEVPDYCYYTKNMWVLNMKTNFEPEFYGPRKSEGVRDATWADEEIYSGCWGRMITSPYPYNVDGNKGYALGIGKWIQKWADDKSFESAGSSTPAADVEDAVEFVPTATVDDYIN